MHREAALADRAELGGVISQKSSREGHGRPSDRGIAMTVAGRGREAKGDTVERGSTICLRADPHLREPAPDLSWPSPFSSCG